MFAALLRAVRQFLDRFKPKPNPPAPPPVSEARLIRVTTEADGEFVNRMYPYWSSAWVDGPSAIVFVGHVDGRPRFFRVALNGSSVVALGPLLPYTGEAEGWYWDASGRVTLCDGPRLRRVDPFTGEDVILFDISDVQSKCDIWQAHSSADGQTHSATVRWIVPEGAYPKLGTIVFRNRKLQPMIKATGDLDESIIDASGRYLLIQESDDNRVFDLENGEERRLSDAAGALAHVDCGDGFAVGEADKPEPGQCARLNLASGAWRALFQTRQMGHVSVKGGRCLQADAQALYLVNRETGERQHLIDHGMVMPPNPTPDEKYNHQVFANLDPSGRVACLISNMGGPRFDAYLYVLP